MIIKFCLNFQHGKLLSHKVALKKRSGCHIFLFYIHIYSLKRCILSIIKFKKLLGYLSLCDVSIKLYSLLIMIYAALLKLTTKFSKRHLKCGTTVEPTNIIASKS